MRRSIFFCTVRRNNSFLDYVSAEWLAENGFEDNETIEELEPWLELEELLETGAFRRDDVDHFQLALGFIESQARC